MLLLHLYHETYHVGYQSILREIGIPFHITEKSLEHNSRLLRVVLAEWGEKRTPLESLAEWKKAASIANIPKALEGVCLWLDSTDIGLEKYEGWSSEDPSCSFKLKRPGS